MDCITPRLTVWLMSVWVGITATLPCWSAPLSPEAESGVINVVTHPDVVVEQLPLPQLRAIFALRVKQWPDGTPIRVFVFDSVNPSELHRRFCRDLLGIYPYQLIKGWQRLTFIGTGSAPETVAGPAAMHAQVRQTPGAIGYLPDDAAWRSGVRVVGVTR